MQCDAIQCDVMQVNFRLRREMVNGQEKRGKSVDYEARTKKGNCNATDWKAMSHREVARSNAMRCDTMRCDAMRRDAMQCNAMQCNAIQRDVKQYDATRNNASDAMQCNLT
jgi:pentapeptide MXKDX repeat protein